MTSRRSFFKRLASLVAVVALAPEIAFARHLETAEVPKLDLQELMSVVYDLARKRQSQPDIDILTDAQGAEVWRQQYPESVMRYFVETHKHKPLGIYEQLHHVNRR